MMKNEQRKSEKVALITISSQRKTDHDFDHYSFCPFMHCLQWIDVCSEAAPTGDLSACVSVIFSGNHWRGDVTGRDLARLETQKVA